MRKRSTFDWLGCKASLVRVVVKGRVWKLILITTPLAEYGAPYWQHAFDGCVKKARVR